MINRSRIHVVGAALLVASLIHVPRVQAVQPAPAPVLCPYPGSGQTGTCTLLNPVAPLLPATQPKYVNELPQPVFYTPDQTSGVFDYYEIFSGMATHGLAAPATPFSAASLTPAVPASVDTWGGVLAKPVNKVWLGLVDPLVPANKLMTEVWGYGQQNMAGGPLGGASTYPAMSFRATKGRPVKVMWVNRLPDQHMFCKFPLNSNYPCGIDRSLMGIKAGVMTPFGSAQQPDNAMVVHLHGGEIPPDSDGFAELWFGNAASAAAYRAAPATVGQLQNVDPPLLTPAAPPNGIQGASAVTPTWWNGNSTPTGDPLAPVLGSLIRPTGDSMIYNYPMVQEAATIWYHDHALAKTRVNVAAGPAGYFYVQDPVVDTALWGATPDAAAGYAFGDCTNGGILAGNCRDVPIVLQDRAFNADGSINFPNGLGQLTKNKFNPLTPGPNPTVHPQWVPEYFGDHAVVNGITWPKLTVKPQAYRIRFLDGSNARCYTLSLTTAAGLPGPAFNLIASDQGYLPAPAAVPSFTMCPGERYEAVIDFSGLAAGTVINLLNTAGAPFPAGITPQAPNSPDKFMAVPMQFVVAAGTPGAPWAPPAGWAAAVKAGVTDRIAALNPAGGPVPPAANPNYYLLNEVLDPLTKAPLKVQIDGKAFEDAVTELPKRGAVQYWDIVNTTVDAHPMHLHLVQFKVVGRWTLDMNKLNKALAAAGFLAPPPATFVKSAVNPAAFVMGPMRAPEPGEAGFKDTAKSMPGEMLRVVARFDGGWADQDPVNPALTPFGLIKPACQAPLPTDVVNAAGCRCVQVSTQVPVLDPVTGLPVIDPVTGLPVTTTVWSCGATIYQPYFQPVTSGPYVWHCHIVDHEDNEMMRPLLVVP